MSNYYQLEPPPERERSAPWSQIAVLLGAMLVLLLVLFVSRPDPQPERTMADETAPRVFFVQPVDGATVPQTFDAVFGTVGLVVEPAGDVHEGAGHYHLLIDTDFIPAGEVIPRDDAHRHFGDASDRTTLTLPPGTHVLRLQFADGAHVALEGEQYQDEITVTVE